MTPTEHIGMRVRMYRTKKKLTLEEFAKKINKAPSTVSKYESGSIVIDVNVVYEMAAALDVTIAQLMDYPMEKDPAPHRAVTGNFFQRTDLYYVYALFAPSKTPSVCAMELHRDEEDSGTGKLVFYFDIDNINNHTNSSYLYLGWYQCFDHGTAFYLNNPYNPSDVGMIYAKSPFSSAATTRGIFTFLPSKIRNPCSTKVLFSISPIPSDQNLIDQLSVSDRETLTTLKRNNLFMVI